MQYHLFTDQGKRNNNEDYIGMTERDGNVLFVLADGLGGHGKGEVASKLVVEQTIEYYRSGDKPPSLAECIVHSQKELLDLQEREDARDGMKTTIVVLEMSQDQARWAHVGDSRLYVFRRGKLQLRTYDHSVPQMLVATGEIKEKDIRHHVDRNRLLRVMGIPWKKPMYTVSEDYTVKPKTAFLLCTDGFWEWMEEKEMEKLLKKADTPEQWIDAMVKEIWKKGEGHSMDNLSAIAVFAD